MVLPTFITEEEEIISQDFINKPFKRLSNGIIFELDKETRHAVLGTYKSNYLSESGVYLPRNPNIQIAGKKHFAEGFDFHIEDGLISKDKFRQQVASWGYYNPKTKQYRSQGSIGTLLTDKDRMVSDSNTWEFEVKFNHKGELKEQLIFHEAPKVLPTLDEFVVIEIFTSGNLPTKYRYSLAHTQDSGELLINNKKFTSTFFQSFVGVQGTILTEGIYPIIIDPFYSEQPDETDGIDTYINNQAATTNFGTSADLIIGELTGSPDVVTRALLKFDVTSITSGSSISAATLSLWVYADLAANSGIWGIHRMIQSWVEIEATWNAYSTGNNWTTAGAFNPADCENTDFGSLSHAGAASGEQQMELDGQSADYAELEDTVGGSPLFTNNGWHWKSDELQINDGYKFRSSSYGTAGERPKLEITYTSVGKKSHRIRRK